MDRHRRFQVQVASRTGLSPDDQTVLDAHLAGCRECRELSAIYARQDALLRGMPPPAYPGRLREKVQGQIETSAPPFWRRIGGAPPDARALAAPLVTAAALAVVALTLVFRAGGVGVPHISNPGKDGGSPSGTTQPPTPGAGTALGVDPRIDGIGCLKQGILQFHVHAHLAIYVRGTLRELPANVGIDPVRGCLYWLHTHDPSNGVIHIESPRHVVPTLGAFFDIWHQPLSSRALWNVTVGPGQSMRVFVNQRPFHGDVRQIRLVSHADITIEIGPPFVPPRPFDFAMHGF